MPEIGVYEAKTRLSELLERVRVGERFIITRHGKAIAQLAPVADGATEERRAALTRLRAFQAGHDPGGVSVRELIDEGRKY